MKQSQKIADKTAVINLMEMPTGGASDIALKKNVIEVAAALERVMALRPVTWQWKANSSSQELQHGFIAQEVERVFPDLVATIKNSDGAPHKFLSTKALIPYLVMALKEQQRQIEALERKLMEIRAA